MQAADSEKDNSVQSETLLERFRRCFRPSRTPFWRGYLKGRSVGYSLGYKRGLSVGHKRGYKSGYAVGKRYGYSSGYSRGYYFGKKHGYSRGYAAAMAKMGWRPTRIGSCRYVRYNRYSQRYVRKVFKLNRIHFLLIFHEFTTI